MSKNNKIYVEKPNFEKILAKSEFTNFKLHTLFKQTFLYLQGLRNGPNHVSFNNGSLRSSFNCDRDLIHELLKIIPTFKVLTAFF